MMILDNIRDTIKRFDMLAPGERVCVALSGGADSVSLLLSLKELGYDVFAVHVNHNLRGEESDRDENFCRLLCKREAVALHVESVDVKGFCQSEKLSLEDGARRLRYEAISKHLCGAKLATAHNLNDCLETTLFNLARGTGLSGLCGIPPVRDKIIRPLIRVTRSEIEGYLADKNQDFVTDSTNLLDDCSRNIIRLNVIPQLLRINPSLMKTYLSTLSVLCESDEYISGCAKELLEASKQDDGYVFSHTDDAVLTSALAMMLRENSIEPSYDRVQRLRTLLDQNGRINIQKGVYVRSQEGKISFEGEKVNLDFEVKACVPGSTMAQGKKVVFTEVSQFDISDYNKNHLKWMLDADKPVGSIVLRSYLGSEKIKLLGKDISQVIKKLLSRYPQEARKSKIVAADECGAVFVEGFGVSERVKCTQDTKRAFKIDII